MKYNKYIDHTLLKPEATKADVQKIVDEAIANDFATVMVNPCIKIQTDIQCILPGHIWCN